jgi:hypothetical protein
LRKELEDYLDPSEQGEEDKLGEFSFEFLEVWRGNSSDAMVLCQVMYLWLCSRKLA